MTTFSRKIYDLFRDNPDRWYTAGEVMESLPGVTRTSVYNTLSMFSLKNPKYLNRKMRDGSHFSEYSFDRSAPAYSDKIRVDRSPRTDVFIPGVKTYWTDREKRDLAMEIARMKLDSWSSPLSILIETAQKKVIDKNRHRHIRTINQVPWIIDMIDQCKEEIKRQREEEKASALAKEDEAATSIEEQTPQEKEQQAIPLPPQPSTLDGLLKDLAKKFGSMIAESLIEALSSPEAREALKIDVHVHHHADDNTEVHTQHHTHARHDTKPKIHVPHIGIIGPIPQQAQVLKSEYPNLKLTIIESHSPNMKFAVANCDRVIGMTSFMSHPTEAVVKKAVGDRYYRIDGGVSSIRRLIDVWIKSGDLKIGEHL